MVQKNVFIYIEIYLLKNLKIYPKIKYVRFQFIIKYEAPATI